MACPLSNGSRASHLMAAYPPLLLGRLAALHYYLYFLSMISLLVAVWSTTMISCCFPLYRRRGETVSFNQTYTLWFPGTLFTFKRLTLESATVCTTRPNSHPFPIPTLLPDIPNHIGTTFKTSESLSTISSALYLERTNRGAKLSVFLHHSTSDFNSIQPSVTFFNFLVREILAYCSVI